MSAIKDIVELATKLSESIQDRRFADDLFKIIRLIGAVQFDQVTLAEKNIQLMNDKSALQETVATLESNVTKLKQHISELQNPTPTIHPELEPDTQNILKRFFDVGHKLSVDEIATPLAIDINTTQYHLDILSNKNFIQSSARSSSTIPIQLKAHSRVPITLEITPEGRKYVIEHMGK